MIRQKPGDLLEIHFDDRFFYAVVLTNIVMFGGGVVFVFHGDGSKRDVEDLAPDGSGFNICTDLRLPKRDGVIRRLGVVPDRGPYWRTRLFKGTNEYRPGYRAPEWFIYRVEDPLNPIDRTSSMSQVYREAMDLAMFSFDLVATKSLTGYTPAQNPFL